MLSREEEPAVGVWSGMATLGPQGPWLSPGLGNSPWPPQQPLEQRGCSRWDTAPGWAGRGRRGGEFEDSSANTRLGPMAVPGWGGNGLIPLLLVPELCPAQNGIILWHGAEPLAPAPSHVGVVLCSVPHPPTQQPGQGQGLRGDISHLRVWSIDPKRNQP